MHFEILTWSGGGDWCYSSYKQQQQEQVEQVEDPHGLVLSLASEDLS